MKKYEPIYAEDYLTYFPEADSAKVLKILTAMFDICFFALAIYLGKIIWGVILLLSATVFTAVMMIIVYSCEHKKITVSHNGVIFENARTGKTKEFAWKDVAAVEYIAYNAYNANSREAKYKIYLKKDLEKTNSSLKKADYSINVTNVERHKIAAFIPQGLHISESCK